MINGISSNASQSGMAAIAAATSSGAGESCGQAYAAVASCVNSTRAISQPDSQPR